MHVWVWVLQVCKFCTINGSVNMKMPPWWINPHLYPHQLPSLCPQWHYLSRFTINIHIKTWPPTQLWTTYPTVWDDNVSMTDSLWTPCELSGYPPNTSDANGCAAVVLYEHIWKDDNALFQRKRMTESIIDDIKARRERIGHGICSLGTICPISKTLFPTLSYVILLKAATWKSIWSLIHTVPWL